MRSDTESFNEHPFFPIRKTIIFRLILILLMCGIAAQLTPAFASPQKENDRNIHSILLKLKKSREQLNFAPNNAEKTCLEALSLFQNNQNDTLHIAVLLQMGDILSIKGNYKDALKYYQQALGKSKTTDYPAGECSALLETGYIQYMWGKYDKSLTYFEEALNISRTNQLKKQEAKALNYVGKYYHTTGKYNRSVEFYKKSAEIARDLKHYDQSVSLFLNIGKTYVSEENIYMTLNNYLKAYETSQKSNNKLHKASVFNHLGSIYLLLKQPDKSLEYHHKALKLREELNSPHAIATSCNNIGETYLYLSSYDSAAVYLKRSYQLCLQIGYLKGTVKALTNLGRVNNGMGYLKRAYAYLTEAFRMAQNAHYNAGVVESSLTLGENQLLKEDYLKAIHYFNLSLSRMIPANLDEFQAEAYRGLYRCYLQLRDYRKALDYHVRLSNAEQKELLAQGNRQLAELRVSFDLERKEADNQKLKQENQLKQLTLTKRAWIIWSVTIILIFTIALLFLIYSRYRQKRKTTNKLRRLIGELELANKEKDNMFSIIAHELRNPLYWFQNLTEILSKNYSTMPAQKLQKSLLSIDESAKNAFHLMDNLLNWSRTRLNRVSPKKSTHQLDALVEETIRMFDTIVAHKQIEIITDLPEGILIYGDADMFDCVLRNLVSNAIKYTPPEGEVHIFAILAKKFCTVTVSDTGIGVSSRKIPTLFQPDNFTSKPGLMDEKGSGLGLKLCKEFTQLNGGDIWVSSKKSEGTCFSFTIPVGK